MAFHFRITLFFFILFSLKANSQGIVFFVNNGVSESNFSSEKLRDIYLKKIRLWDDGKKIRPIDFNVGSAERVYFLKYYVDKNELQLTDYWIQEKQNSGSIQPLQISNQDMMFYLVETMSGSIGYALSNPENLNIISTKKLKVINHDKR